MTVATQTATAPMLELQGVNSYYGESHILHDLSLNVQKSEIVALLGRNGVGKTTTIQTILGLPVPRAGEIRYKGELISGLPTYDIVRRGIGWVPQGHRIFSTLSVDENLQLAAAKARPGTRSLTDIYDLFPRLQVRRDARGDTLSGGEQQMLAVGRALMTNPDCLIMDEPSEGLAPIIIQGLWEAIGKLKEQGMSILLVEQNTHLALKLVDYVHVMSKGHVVYSGTPAELRANDAIRSDYLGI